MNVLKRIGWGSLSLLLLLTSVLALVPSRQASAAGEESMCVPVYTDRESDLGGDRWDTDWIEIRFISRFEVNVQYTGTGTCQAPANLSAEFLHESGTLWTDYINQTLILREMDGRIRYGLPDASGTEKDETLIEIHPWSSFPGVLGAITFLASWQSHALMTDEQVQQLFYRAEYDIGIEEDALNGAASCSGDDSNFHLVNMDSDNQGPKWRCSGDSDQGIGADVLSSAVGLENFNTAFKVSEDGTKIFSLLAPESSEFTFSFCQGSQTYENDNCNGGVVLSGLTLDAAKALGANASNFTVTGAEGGDFQVRVAGAEYATNTTEGGNALPTEPSCESEGGVFSWILCGALDMTSKFLQFVDNQLVSLLNVPSDYYRGEALEAAWSRARNIAFLLLIPIFLVMIISTMLGFGFVDAYTVKRSLPRLLFAVIFIALSLPICQILVTMANDVGQGVYGLVVGSLTDGRESLTELFDPNNVQGGLFLAAGIVGAFLAPGMIVTILLFGLSAALVLLTAFFLLALRQMLIVALMILAPLAILSWIFPGNDKLWKLWWNSFSKLLMLFPIIMLLIATGKVFAAIVDGVAESSFINTILILVAYVGPYFMIPATFKMAGGAFANLAGIVNNRGKGAFDRLRNARSKQYKSRWGDARAGNFYKGGKEGSLRSRINRGLEGATNIDKAGFNPMQMRSKMRTALNDHSHDDATKFMKEDHSFNAFSGDDAKLAAAKFEKREDIERELARFDPGRFAGAGNARARTDAATQIMRAQRATNRETFQRARARAMASTGTGYQYTDANGNTVVDVSRMVDDINEAYGNDRGGAGRALAEMRGSLSNSGQIAGMAGFGTWASVMEQRYRGAISNQDAHNVIMDDAIASSSPGQALYGKPTSAAAMGAAHARRIQAVADRVSAARAGIQAGTHTQVQLDTAQADLDAATAAAAGLLDAMGQASPQNASAFANELMGVTIRGSALPGGGGPVLLGPNGQPIAGGGGATGPDVTVRQMIDERMNHEEYRNRRRDYGSQALTQGAAYQQQMAAQNAANAAAGGGGLPGAGGMGGGPPGVNISDSRLKENVHYLETRGGVNLYSFNYIGSNETYVGVLAQEILESYPEAVVKNELGFYAVDYSKIGVAMTTLEEWQKNANNVLLP